MSGYTVLPLFPSAVFVTRVEADLDATFERIRKDYEYVRRVDEDERASLMTRTTFLLDDHPALAALLLEYFSVFKDQVLRFETTRFAITTSWATRASRGESSQFHRHANCVYSGVLYFEDADGAGELEFDDANLAPSSFLLSDPVEWNLLNSKTWSIAPAKNRLVFFPSYLRHRITPHGADTPRHSLAFNLIPTGAFGRGDSYVQLDVK